MLPILFLAVVVRPELPVPVLDSSGQAVMLPVMPEQPKTSVRKFKDSSAIFFQSKMSCCVDGSPRAYHPTDDRLALDDIVSAGGEREGGGPFGPLTKLPSRNVVAYRDGKPFIQSSGPNKDFYVSKTAYQEPSLEEWDPGRYLDPLQVHYIVIPGGNKGLQVPGIELGDLGAIYDPKTMKIVFGIFGEVGPSDRCGEASMKCHQDLGYPEVVNGRSSGGNNEERRDVFYLVFPKTKAKLVAEDPWPHEAATIERLAKVEFEAWGGMSRLASALAG